MGLLSETMNTATSLASGGVLCTCFEETRWSHLTAQLMPFTLERGLTAQVRVFSPINQLERDPVRIAIFELEGPSERVERAV